MMKLTKSVSAFLMITLFVVSAFLAYALNWRHVYTAEDKVDCFNMYASRAYHPGIESSVRFADVIVEGTVVSAG